VADVTCRVATRADWKRVSAVGDHARSTMDKTLVEGGFSHAPQAAQVAKPANKSYRGGTGDLVLLVVDEARVRRRPLCETACRRRTPDHFAHTGDIPGFPASIGNSRLPSREIALYMPRTY
jgi:uncharacterized protein (DUF952 family)